jgi:hypothetical protein
MRVNQQPKAIETLKNIPQALLALQEYLVKANGYVSVPR